MTGESEAFETLSVRSGDLEERAWSAQSEAINSEIQDILVDVLVVFLQLPALSKAQSSVEAWAQAFEQLFDLVPGLKPVFEMAPLDDAELQFEGRPGRLYLPIEEEYFLATFFQDFWEMLVGTDKLGDLAAGSTLSDPRDDLINVYEYVKERKQGGRRSRRESSFKESVRPLLKEAAHSEDRTLAALEDHLNSTLDAASESDPPYNKLLDTAQAVYGAADTPVGKFFSTFKRQEFSVLYGAVRGTPAARGLLDVLTKYYLEYLAEPHMFNAPDLGTFVKDLQRAQQREERRSSSVSK